MYEFLRDPVWQFVGIIIGIVTIGITIIVFFLQRKKKSLSYEIITNSSLLSMKDEIKGKIKIFYEDIQVKKVHLLTFRVFNSGNTPIESTDFERPLTISLGSNSRILSHEITNTTPTNFQIDYSIDGESIVFVPCLINRKDSFIFKVLISDYRTIFHADARIVGVSEIKNENSKIPGSVFLYILGFILMIGGLSILTTTGEEQLPFKSPLFYIVNIVIFIGFLILGIPYVKELKELSIDYIRKWPFS